MPVRALTAVSAMGWGFDEMADALRERRSGLTPCDFGGISRGYIGRVRGVEAVRLAPGLERYTCRNNQLAEAGLRSDGFDRAVVDARGHYGAERIGVVVGTSTSGILAGEEAYLQRDPEMGALPASFDHEHTHDMFSAARYVREALGLRGPALSVSTACASSARAFLDAAQLIESDVCDAVVVGGVDTLCRLTLRGFDSLALVAEGPCRPCDAGRDGVSIGEAAGFALVVRPEIDDAAPLAVLGCGASSDGYHMSSPDPKGAGAIGAMRDALNSAGLDAGEIDYVNLHGTGTLVNDAMEDGAVHAVFGGETPCSSTKGWSGHALGASGILEAAVSALAIRDGVMPGCLGVRRIDPGFKCRTLVENVEARVGRVMSNSFGFGGVNCSLILGSCA